MKLRKILTFFGWPLLVLPLLLFSLGAGLNEVAAVSNGGVMPVYSKAYIEELQYKDQKAIYTLVKNKEFSDEPDFIHEPATSKTKYHYLCDIFIADDGIFSVGDYIGDIASEIQEPLFFIWVLSAAFCWQRKRPFYLHKFEEIYRQI